MIQRSSCSHTFLVHWFLQFKGYLDSKGLIQIKWHCPLFSNTWGQSTNFHSGHTFWHCQRLHCWSFRPTRSQAGSEIHLPATGSTEETHRVRQKVLWTWWWTSSRSLMSLESVRHKAMVLFPYHIRLLVPMLRGARGALSDIWMTGCIQQLHCMVIWKHVPANLIPQPPVLLRVEASLASHTQRLGWGNLQATEFKVLYQWDWGCNWVM